ncbi:MAG: AI-2E family transporter [Anaerovoracaceae bacterium]
MSRFRDYFPDKRWYKYSMFVGITAALLYALYFIIKNFHIVLGFIFSTMSDFLSALSPLFIGLILTYLLSPLVEKININIVSKVIIAKPRSEDKLASLQKKKRLISVLITYFIILLAVIAVLYAFSVLILGQFIFSGLNSMIDSLLEYVSAYESNIRSWIAGLPNLEIADRLQDIANNGMLWLSQQFSAGAALSKISEISGSVVNFVLGIIVSIYILMDKEFFIRLWRKFLHLALPQKANAVLTETLHDIDSVLSAFIRGALLDALIIAILSSIGLSVLGLDFAVFIGCFAGVANVIPYFGPVLGMIPAFIVGLFTGGLTRGILAVVILLIIQQIDCNLIYPKIVGSTTGLHPLFVLLAVSVAGYYGGIFGMILAVPLAGIAQTFILKWVSSREAKLSAQLESESPETKHNF